MTKSYEELKQQHLEDAFNRLPEHMARLTWSADRLRDERTAKLRSLLRTAADNSRWHRSRLAHINVDAFDESGLSSITPMTKDDLMSNWDDIVTVDGITLDALETHLATIESDAYFSGTLHGVASGGSSGRRGAFVYDWDAWMDCYLGFARYFLLVQQQNPQAASGSNVTAVVAADKPTHMTSAMAQTFSNPLIESHRFPASLPLEEIVSGLNRVQPGSLMGYPSMLVLLAHEAKAGRLTIQPSALTPSSEPLHPEVRELLEETFQCPVANWWGTTEGGATGISCGLSPGMHLSEDLLIIEPVDKDGNPVPPGTRSDKVYLTNLMNRALPLIRYELTDEVTFMDDTPCPCGSTHRKIEDIQGRQDDSFEYSGGIIVHPITFRSPLGRDRNIVEYQVRQTAGGADIRIITTGEVDQDLLKAQISEALAQQGVPQARINILVVEQLERTGLGKMKRFFPLPTTQ
jgi:phenylacetate-coenzyme A ligase PaaK-like adenylate-forming protein